MKNLGPYAPKHLQLDVDAVLRMCEGQVAEIVASQFTRNPWQPTNAPQLQLLPE
jgi:hypothetical protein